MSNQLFISDISPEKLYIKTPENWGYELLYLLELVWVCIIFFYLLIYILNEIMNTRQKEMKLNVQDYKIANN